jgi:hypothetical protein
VKVLSQPLTIPKESMLNLKDGDSVIFYQCHVEQAVTNVTTASGQTLTGGNQACSITEKYVLTKKPESFEVSYYVSALNVLPNKKFSGLKIRERPYWGFKPDKKFALTEKDLKVFLALERKGHEAIEFDYGITRRNTNQIIIKRHKDFKQLVIDGDYVISRLITM